jgi:hypothetical protein
MGGQQSGSREKRFREAPSFTVVFNLIIAVICEAILLLDKDDKDDKAKLHESFDDAEGTDSEASSFPQLKFREQLNCLEEQMIELSPLHSSLSHAAVFDESD